MNMVFYDISKIKNTWRKKKLPVFLKYSFLHSFSINNKELKHLFWHHANSVVYAQIISLNLYKIINYSNANFFINYIVKYIKIDILFLGNSYITNFPFFQFQKKYKLSTIINSFPNYWSALVIPDMLFEKIQHQKPQEFIKLEIEEDMILTISKNWKVFKNYQDSLRKKYEKKISKTLQKSKKIKIQKLTAKEVELYYDDLQILYESIMSQAKFNGVKFNIKTFIPLIRYNYANIYGYFLKNKMVAFASELISKENVYSYYVGFDKKLNKEYDLYSRILIENIKNGIQLKKKRIIFGRTASEFKSNFGAVPNKAYIYIKFRNVLLHYFFKFYFKRIHIKAWSQRKPFRIN